MARQKTGDQSNPNVKNSRNTEPLFCFKVDVGSNMGQGLEENSPIDSLKEPLLAKRVLAEDDGNSLADDGVANNGNNESNKPIEEEASADHKGGVDASVVQSIRSQRAIGQWIWLYVVWSINLHVDVFVVSIIAWSLTMVGHCYFLVKLSILFPDRERKECRRAAELNQETLPIILSGLRLFCFGTYVMPDTFLAIIGISFLLFELFWSCCGCLALSTLLQKHNILYVDCYGQNQEGNDRADHLEAQNENSASQQADEIERDDSDSRFLNWPARRDCAVVCHWIWFLFVWGIIRTSIAEDGFSHEDSRILTWLLAMLGHGMLLVVMTKSRKERPSFFRVSRDTVPMIISGSFLLDAYTADDWLGGIAMCFVICQTGRVVWRFVLNMTFATFANMEKDYFERLKEEEVEEAAQLEAQMQRMAYLETAPRPDPAKRRRRHLR